MVCESSDVRKFLKKSKFQNFSELFKVKTIVSFKSIGISSCGGIRQSWRNRVICSHICNVCCARVDGFKSRCYIFVYIYINFKLGHDLLV